jgi:predicted RNase H-like nuclease (RuvC/YqgF family)
MTNQDTSFIRENSKFDIDCEIRPCNPYDVKNSKWITYTGKQYRISIIENMETGDVSINVNPFRDRDSGTKNVWSSLDKD